MALDTLRNGGDRSTAIDDPVNKSSTTGRRPVSTEADVFAEILQVDIDPLPVGDEVNLFIVFIVVPVVIVPILIRVCFIF